MRIEARAHVQLLDAQDSSRVAISLVNSYQGGGFVGLVCYHEATLSHTENAVRGRYQWRESGLELVDCSHASLRRIPIKMQEHGVNTNQLRPFCRIALIGVLYSVGTMISARGIVGSFRPFHAPLVLPSFDFLSGNAHCITPLLPYALLL